MDRAIYEKIGADAHIRQAQKAKERKAYKKILIYAVAVLYAALVLCFVAHFRIWGWVIALTAAALLILLPLFILRRALKARIFFGTVTRIEEDRRTIPRRGTGAFGRSNLHLAEVYELVVAIEDETATTQVIFCPAQYERVLKVGDRVLCHSALPYPAHLSNPTKCICMHCGAMQSSENTACITCAADVYNLNTVQTDHPDYGGNKE